MEENIETEGGSLNVSRENVNEIQDQGLCSL